MSRLSGAIILRVSYGYKVNFDAPDPFIKMAEKFSDILSRSSTPGKWLVDALPSCTCSSSLRISAFLMHIRLSEGGA